MWLTIDKRMFIIGSVDPEVISYNLTNFTSIILVQIFKSTKINIQLKDELRF